MPQQESGSPRTWGGLLFAAALTAIVFAQPSPLDATVHSQAAGVAGPVRTLSARTGIPYLSRTMTSSWSFCAPPK